MNTVKVISPDTHDFPGVVHTIPEADLQGFLAEGWTLAEEKPSNKKK